jgi:hypothetical protein
MAFLEHSYQFVKHVRSEGVDRTPIQLYHQNVWTLVNQNVPGMNSWLPNPVTCDTHKHVALPWRGIGRDT